MLVRVPMHSFDRRTSALLLSALFACVAVPLLGGCPGDIAPYTRGDGGSTDAPTDRTIDDDASIDEGDGASESDTSTPQQDSGATTPTGTGALCGVNGRNDCGPFLKCDGVLGCVACTSDGDCPLSERHCYAGKCGACTPGQKGIAPGCPVAAPSCWPGDRSCHTTCDPDAGTCLGKASLCEVSTGECHACEPGTCDAGVCSPTTHTCVACVADTDCPSERPRCDAARSQCVECTYDEDCGITAPVCDPKTRACRAGCIDDTQCPGQTCDPKTALCVDLVPDAGADADADADAAD